MSLWSKIRTTVMAVAAVLNITSNDVCFEKEGLGCFSNKAPFNNARGLLPQAPNKMNLTYYLYTPKNINVKQVLTSDTVRTSFFNNKRKTKFIIHGYRDDCDTSWVYAMKDALLRKGNYNVICVDWDKGADQMDYNQAVANTKIVGAMLAKFIRTLRGNYNVICVDWDKGADQMDYNQAVANTRVVGTMLAKFIRTLRGNYNVICVDWDKGADQMDYNQAVANTRVVGAMLAKFMRTLRVKEKAKYYDMHLIGHSLGAHIAGYAGSREKTLGRITGLDPAGPGFEKSPSVVGLDRTDAKFVDVVHTDGEPLTKLGFGLKKAVGHVDFYPNGGVDQPGCKNVAPHIFRLIKGKLKDFVKGIACDHARARDLFTESINSPCGFKAYPCATNKEFKDGKCKKCNGRCAKFGYNSDLNPAPVGKYYMSTHKKAPFCQS